MTNRSIAALVLKIWGVLWLVAAVSGFFNTGLQLFSGHSADQTVWSYAIRSNTLAYTFTFLIGLLLVRSGEAIARFVFPEVETLALDFDAGTLQAVAFSILAIYFAMGSLRSIVAGLYGLATKPPQDSVAYVWARNKEHLVSSLVELGAAVVLFFGTPALVRFTRRLQEPWTRPDAPAAEVSDAESPESPSDDPSGRT